MFRINRRAVSATPALVSLAWVWVIWEDMRCMVTEWNAIHVRTLRHWRAPGQWWCDLWRGVTPHKFIPITRNFQSQKTKDSAWMSYIFLYRISNAFDPTVKVYVISKRPSYYKEFHWILKSCTFPVAYLTGEQAASEWSCVKSNTKWYSILFKTC